MFKITIKVGDETSFLKGTKGEELEFSSMRAAQAEIDAADNIGFDTSGVSIVEDNTDQVIS